MATAYSSAKSCRRLRKMQYHSARDRMRIFGTLAETRVGGFVMGDK
jgi:hypothetical protein